MTRLGVFGSSFNPPTLGHVALLAEARWRLELDRVIVVPTGNAWHKASSEDPGGAVRLKLAQAAFQGVEQVEVSSVEVDREGPSYTYETLEEIQQTNLDSQLVLLLGADAALGFPGWKHPDRVLAAAQIAVASRVGVDTEQVSRAFEQLGEAARIEFFEMLAFEVSSSLVRQRIEAGAPWKHLVPHQVAEMIDNESLYGN